MSLGATFPTTASLHQSFPPHHHPLPLAVPSSTKQHSFFSSPPHPPHPRSAPAPPEMTTPTPRPPQMTTPAPTPAVLPAMYVLYPYMCLFISLMCAQQL